MAVLLWYFPVEAETLDAGLLQPGLGDVQCEPPRGEDDPDSLWLAYGSQRSRVHEDAWHTISHVQVGN